MRYNQNMNKIVVLILSVVILAGLTWFIAHKETPPQAPLYSLIAGNTELKVELAESQGQRGQGLGDRKSLPENQGMLFIFDKPDIYPFWMRDMKFPLDIIWLDPDYKVVHIASDVKPDTYPQAFQSTQPAQYVLEINAGVAEKNNVTTGSRIIFLWQVLENIEKKKDLIHVSQPQLMDTINKLGFIVKGEARGNWFFEASFPIRLIDTNGNIIFNSHAQALKEWMTTDFVPFDEEFYFDMEPTTKYGLLILKKDNPSGLPQNDDQIEIPVQFK